MVAGEYSILLGAISSVLAGAIFGDHCSPISDTTVLSSTAAACDHLDHVKTQLPYAMLVAILGMGLGDVGTALGLPAWDGPAPGSLDPVGLPQVAWDCRAEPGCQADPDVGPGSRAVSAFSFRLTHPAATAPDLPL